MKRGFALLQNSKLKSRYDSSVFNDCVCCRSSVVLKLKVVALACCLRQQDYLAGHQTKPHTALFTSVRVPDLISAQSTYPANFSNPALRDRAQIWEWSLFHLSKIIWTVLHYKIFLFWRCKGYRMFCRADPALSCSIWLLRLCWLKLRRQQVCLSAFYNLERFAVIQLVIVCTSAAVVGVVPPSCIMVGMINWLDGAGLPGSTITLQTSSGRERTHDVIGLKSAYLHKWFCAEFNGMGREAA